MSWRPLAIMLMLVPLAGCDILPQRQLQPTLHNPFPQLTTIAIIPFLNKCDDPTVNGAEFAEAYFNELQQIPGFEVISVSTVEQQIKANEINLAGPNAEQELYRLGQILDVDAIVVGAVNDFDAFYPPRCALEVEWYAMNPCFHPIPPGYGLPWGTPKEDEIPGEVLLEAEMALARAQMETQTPDPNALMPAQPAAPPLSPTPNAPADPSMDGPGLNMSVPTAEGQAAPRYDQYVTPAQAMTPIAPNAPLAPDAAMAPNGPTDQAAPMGGDVYGDYADQGPMYGVYPGLPESWPDPQGFIPDGPLPSPPPCIPSQYKGRPTPVLRHTAVYNGNDSDVTAALQSFYDFQDDKRVGSWEHYLRRSDDFIRFCCRMHIWEMLSARGGAGESRVVWRLPKCR